MHGPRRRPNNRERAGFARFRPHGFEVAFAAANSILKALERANPKTD